ncbi:hypothetical protein ARALYDRAFT_476134 [Arabidopsis lyrata subsp. lyrata]|uniref:TPX2 C-terminal domain-containing protein n=1 Tax=Arabidopsis lyrata subsp. lyrata TaxID=81972 RepID=D7KXX7_ARALL|nr:hypothetical protein ARALYDRAFT_476134 [Arabidopsis lyrata subsp. lyrata]
MVDMEVGTANGEDKIMTATSSNQELQVSVSFGKFENDSLSWEKFSSFSPNKYLEEVEKCATAGSVAQKKAYFESHYKKIAERRADIIMEQEKLLKRNASFRPSVQNREKTDNSDNDESMMIEFSAGYGSNGESTSEEDKLVTGIATETCNQKPLEETMDFVECRSSVDAGDDLSTLKLEEKLEEIVQVEDKEKLEEVVCMKEEVKEDVPSKDIGEMNEALIKETKKETEKTDKNVRTNHMRASPKSNQATKKPVASKIVTSTKTQSRKERSMTKATNKAASPVLKPPSSTISSMSTSRSSVKKENVSALPRKKQTAPKSLQVPLNVDQSCSDPTAVPTTRKSLIMERMGDKDIVRRAFKTFQKSFDQIKPSGDEQEQDTAPKQVPAKATAVSRLGTTGQKNSRLAKSEGTERKGSYSHGSSSFVSKSNGTAEKQKEVTYFMIKPNCVHLIL